MQTGIVDYTAYPLVARGGLMQLVYRKDDTSFRCAVVSNTEKVEWEAENLCRPFLRLPFDGEPTATSRPGCLTITDGALTMEVRRSSILHAVHVTVMSPEPIELYCGPAGKFDNYGYTQHQDSSFFLGFPDETVQDSCWLTHRNEWTGALDPGSGEIKNWGRGVTVALPAGRSVLSFAAAKSKDEAIAAAKQASSMSAEEAEAFLVKTWDSVMAKVPESILGLAEPVRTKAIEAIYLHLEGCRFEPLGLIRHPAPAAGMTGYRGPVYNWDNSISAAALASIDPEYAMGIILNFLENANPDGSIPVTVDVRFTGGTSGIGSCFKHLLSWASWHIYQASPSRDVLDALLPGLFKQCMRLREYALSCPDALVRVDAIDDNTPSDDSTRRLVQPDHFGSKDEPVHFLVAGAEVSGFMANELICCARLCKAAGREEDAGMLTETARAVAEGAAKNLWNSEKRDIGYLYADDFMMANNPHRFMGAALMPGGIRDTMTHAMRKGGPLWPKYGIATFGADDPGFDPNQMWRGPIWLGMNYLIAESCASMGLTDLADDISVMTQNMGARNSGFWECTNPLTGRGFRVQLLMGLNASAFLLFCLGKHRTPAWVRPEELS